MAITSSRSWIRTLGILSLSAVVFTGCFMLSMNANASRPPAQENPPSIEARPADVASMDAIVLALYDTISGPAGPRDWDRLRSLFIPGARLIPCRKPQGATKTETAVFTVEEFIKRVEANSKQQGFFEREISRKLDRFGSVAHVFSTYESRHDRKDAQPFTRGINSIQLFFDGTRWWVVTIYWDSERADQAIPREYLPSK